MILIKKRNCGRLGVLFLAFRKTCDITKRHGHRFGEYLICVADTVEQINLYAYQYKLNEGLEDDIISLCNDEPNHKKMNHFSMIELRRYLKEKSR